MGWSQRSRRYGAVTLVVVAGFSCLDALAYLKLRVHLPALLNWTLGGGLGPLREMFERSGVGFSWSPVLFAAIALVPALVWAALSRIPGRARALALPAPLAPALALQAFALYAGHGHNEARLLPPGWALVGDHPELGHTHSPALPGRHPNVFVVVLESFRQDTMTPEHTPSLHAFAREFDSVKAGIAAGNATHLSWFSILTGLHPMRWRQAFTAPSDKGSAPMRLLRDAGYEIHVFSSSILTYFKTAEIAFGRERRLASTWVDEAKFPLKHQHEKDAAALDALLSAARTNGPAGHAYFLFLDSMHFPYDWPAASTRYRPVASEANLFKLTYETREVEEIRNRYLNAASHVDNQLRRLFEGLRASGQWRDSIVVVTGDHGEEFYEHGVFTHSSLLCEHQTRVPLVYKLGTSRTLPPDDPRLAVGGHVDILPTVLRAVGYTDMPGMDGRPISERAFPGAFSVDVKDSTRILFSTGDSRLELREQTSSAQQTYTLEAVHGPTPGSLEFTYRRALEEALPGFRMQRTLAALSAPVTSPEPPLGPSELRERFRGSGILSAGELPLGRAWDCRMEGGGSARQEPLFRFYLDIPPFVRNSGARDITFYAIANGTASGFSPDGAVSYLRKAGKEAIVEELTAPATSKTPRRPALSDPAKEAVSYSLCTVSKTEN